MLTHLYALSGPDGRVRYVGKTRVSLERRLTEHLSEARRGLRNHRCNWIRSVQFLVTADLVESVVGEGVSEEVSLIASLRTLGVSLVNGTPGGEGTLFGVKRPPVSAATRKKISDAGKGRIVSAETKAKISAARKGIRPPPVSAETRAKIGAAQRGKPKTLEHRARIAAAHRGKKKATFTDRHLEAMRAAQKNKKPAPPVSEETRRRMSEAQKKRAPPSAETRAKMSSAFQGRVRGPVSEETRKKISESRKGISRGPDSPQTVQKKRDAARRFQERRKELLSAPTTASTE